MISAKKDHPRLTLWQRAAMNVDRASAYRAEAKRVERETAERITELRRIVFHNAARGRREIEDLTNEPDAARLLIRAAD